jgi:hypothetical protein
MSGLHLCIAISSRGRCAGHVGAVIAGGQGDQVSLGGHMRREGYKDGLQSSMAHPRLASARCGGFTSQNQTLWSREKRAIIAQVNLPPIKGACLGE